MSSKTFVHQGNVGPIKIEDGEVIVENPGWEKAELEDTIAREAVV